MQTVLCLEKITMKPKQRKLEKVQVRQILDDDEDYDSSTTATRSTITFSSSNSSDNDPKQLTQNNNNSTSSTDTINSASSSDNNTASSCNKSNNTASSSSDTGSTSTSLLPINIIGRKSTSTVWLYAIKSDDGKMATCRLCDYTCSVVDHSTSTIRYHLIREHDKHDLIMKRPSTSSSEPHVSEHLKRDLHSLCYRSIIIDQRPFNDFQKNGIVAIFNKLCPGKKEFSTYTTSPTLSYTNERQRGIVFLTAILGCFTNQKN